MKVYVVISIGSGQLARICSTKEFAIDTANKVHGGIWKAEFEVKEMEVDGSAGGKIVYSTLDKET